MLFVTAWEHRIPLLPWGHGCSRTPSGTQGLICPANVCQEHPHLQTLLIVRVQSSVLVPRFPSGDILPAFVAFKGELWVSACNKMHL